MTGYAETAGRDGDAGAARGCGAYAGEAARVGAINEPGPRALQAETKGGTA
ncbi:hypothetical protein [Plantactinospora sp. CA-290183]|uniref:hypothetical protein n=1 Tax=Plantactinospora sp. CA-290183 TaxID=3240006 RepID=UPI003D90518D